VLEPARVVVPYARQLAPEVIWALQEAEVEFELVNVAHSDFAYYHLLCGLWKLAEPFTIVEHDIVVRPDVLASFDNCAHEWCAASYPYLRSNYWGLGCTRFRRELLQRFPDVMEEVGRYESPRHIPGHWCILDQALTASLRARRVDWPHTHGDVGHLGDGLPAHHCRV
jgi:hypothetical protein